MKPVSFILTVLVLAIQLSCEKSQDMPVAFHGNYFDTGGEKYWIGSIFQDYIIYENDFWTYEVKSISENEINIRLKSGSGEKRKLEISKQEALFLVTGLEESYLCNKSGKGFKIKPGKGKPVLNAGVAVLKGVVVGDSSGTGQVKITAETYFSPREAEVQITDVNERGQFTLSIPMLKSQSVFLHYGEKRWRRLFLTPKDSLMILIDGKSGRPEHFMGTNADVCYHTQYVLDTLYNLGESRRRNWSLEPLDFREYRDSLTSVQHKFLAEYCAQNQCSDLFIKWCRSFINCYRGLELGMYSYMSTNYGRGAAYRLGADHPYYGYIKTINYNDTMLLLEADAGDLLGNLNLYYNMVLRQEINSEARIHKDIYNFLFNYTAQISEEDMLFLKSLSDSLEVHQTFSRGLVNKLVSIAEPFKDEYDFRLMTAQMDRRMEYFMEFKYSLMRDLLLMKVYDDMKRARMLDELDYVYNRINTLIQYHVFKEDLKNDYSAFLQKTESFQNVDFIGGKSTLPGEKLLLDIINSYKDTLVVLDFWYTSCGPCRSGFEKMKKIKKQMYDVPIKYVYLCYSSSEKDWTNVVKEFDVQGDHYLLSREQYAYFSNLFNISSAPRYVLIGKNGKIANDDFIQPHSYQQYMAVLQKYLRN